MPRLSPHLRSALALLALLGAGIIFYAFDPAGTPWLYPACPLHTLFGLHCPGCGGTRALHALLHGEWARAGRLNPLVFTAPALPAVAFLLARLRPAPRAGAWLGLCAALLLVMLWRNLA